MATLALVSTGVLMVYSISAVKSPSGVQFKTELVYVALGVTAMFLLAHVDYHYLRRPGVYRSFALLVFLLLVLVLIPGIGVERNGAQRWLRIFQFQFQPSEFAKFAVILLLAVKLTENQDHIQSFSRGFLPPIAVTASFALLILLENDLGMPMMVMCIAFMMVFTAGARWRYLLASSAPIIAGFIALSVTSAHRLPRLFAYLDPWRYAEKESYQLVQSLTAFARGAIWGCGLGAGEQKLWYLPEADTDFIFSIIGEEMGLVGALMLATLYAALTVAAFRIAVNARDLFGALLATGIVSMIAFQAAFIMAMTTGLLPTKGLPLPFVSYGGTALIVSLMLMGLLINIGRQAQEPHKKPLFARAA
jgi:cell division protein FtsW